MGAEHGQKVAFRGTIERRAGFDVAFDVSKQNDALHPERTLRQAIGERLLPIAVGLELLVLEVRRGPVGDQFEAVLGVGEGGALA